MGQAGKNRNILTHIGATMTFVVMVFCILLGGNAYKTIRLRLYQERAEYFDSISGEINENIQDSVRYMWKFTELARNSFVSDNPTTLAQACRSINYMTSSLRNSGLEFYIIDSDDTYYDGYGNTKQWAGGRLPTGGFKRFVYMPEKVSNPQDSFFKYVIRFNENIVVKDGDEDIELAYIMCNVKTSCLSGILKSQVYNRKNHACIVEKNGSKVYYDRSDNTIFTGKNITERLKSFNYKYGTSYDEFYKCWQEDKSYTALVEYNGKNYFISVLPMKVGDVSLIILANEEYVYPNSPSFVATILKQAVTIGCALLVLVILVFFIVMHANNEHKMAQNEIENNKKLTDANNALTIATKEANKANHIKTEFLTRVSHDIRTPLNAIMGMAAIARKNEGDALMIEDCLNKIDISSNHLMGLINEILDITKLENGVNLLVEETFDMRTVINTCVVVINNCIGERPLAMECRFDEPEYPYVFGSPLHVRQILINILGNSVKYTDDGGNIIFKMSEKLVGSDTVEYKFIIQDDGIGMSREFLEHIFDEFTQESIRSRDDCNGTGLGMAIVKRLVDKMEGSIDVKSRPGIGSRFEVTIPFKIMEEADCACSEEPKAEKDFDGARILLVEDNEMNRDIIRYMLREKKVVVDEAGNGMRGLNMYLNQPDNTYNMILMDVMMPIMDGIEAVKAIRNSKKADAHTIPVLAMTANVFSEDVKNAKNAGMTDYIPKPVDMELLFAKIEKWYNQIHP